MKHSDVSIIVKWQVTKLGMTGKFKGAGRKGGQDKVHMMKSMVANAIRHVFNVFNLRV